MSILVNTGFKVGGAEPLNEYSVRETVDDRDDLVTNGYVYEGMEVYCKDTKIKYRWNGAAWDILDNAPTDESTHKTTIYENHIDMGKYILLAKITDANYTNNIIKFSCPNYKGSMDVGFKYEDDMDIYKFELHFNTGSRRENNGYGVTLKQHGLGLYSYPLSNPKNTEPRLEEAIRLYWDYSKGEIYVFLVDIMTAIPHCVLEYTGSGTLLKENTFIMDDLYNRREGLNGTWEDSKWKSIPFNKLEVPPIYELGGGSAEGSTTYTSIEDLGLTAPVTVGEIFNAMPNNTMAVIACEEISEIVNGTSAHVTDVPTSFGILTIKKKNSSRFSIDYQNSLGGSPCDVKRWIGTLKGLDGTGLCWKQLSAEPTFVTLRDIGLTADATFQDVVDALPRGGSALLGVKDFTNYQTIFPYEEGNDQFARVYIVKGWDDGSCVYARWFRKDGSKEAIAIFNINDNTFNGWKMLKNQLIYTSLGELGLDTTAKINDIVSAMKNGTTFTYKTDVFDYATEYENLRYATVTIIKQTIGRVQIFMTDKNTGNLYIGIMSSDNKIVGWSKVQTEVEATITEDTIAKYGTEILKYPVGTWRINSVNIGNQFTDLPLKDVGSVIEIDSIDPNRSPYEYSYGYRNYIFKSSLDCMVYIRTLNSGDIAGTMARDTGWQKIATQKDLDELYQKVTALIEA